MRFLHTADWHLGHTLKGFDREAEHRAFLAWLAEQVERTDPDAIIIPGDVFDVQNPSAAAQRMYYRFLAGIARRRSGRKLQLVVTAGNHDSASRMDAPAEILQAFDVQVVGATARDGDGRIDIDRMLVPILGHSGEIEAVVAAVPFLRPVDLMAGRTGSGSVGRDAEDPDFIAPVRAIYREIVDRALEQRLKLVGQEVPLIVTGHLYMVGGKISELSERRIFGGHQHAVPTDIFADEIAYGCLGHLHLAQAVGGKQHIRYSGSPIPLSATEASYPHQVVLVDLGGDGEARIEELRVPRTVGMVRVPKDGTAQPPDVVLDQLAALEAWEGPADQAPFLDVVVQLDAPRPLLRNEVEAALSGKRHRLVRLQVERPAAVGIVTADMTEKGLAGLTPLDVFARVYARKYPNNPEPRPDLKTAFTELAAAVEQADAEEAAEEAAKTAPLGSATASGDTETVSAGA